MSPSLNEGNIKINFAIRGDNTISYSLYLVEPSVRILAYGEVVGIKFSMNKILDALSQRNGGVKQK